MPAALIYHDDPMSFLIKPISQLSADPATTNYDDIQGSAPSAPAHSQHDRNPIEHLQHRCDQSRNISHCGCIQHIVDPAHLVLTNDQPGFAEQLPGASRSI